MIRRALIIVVGLALAGGACVPGDLSPAKAVALLRASPDVTGGSGGAVQREVVDVTAVRRLSRTALEVEFRWRIRPGRAGEATPVRESMALFRLQGRAWVLASLYRFD